MITKRSVKIPIFNYKINIIVYDNNEDVSDTYDSKGSRGFVLDYGTYSTVGIKYPNEHSIIHESEHLKNSIWEYIGYTPQRGNDEVDAYLITYIYIKILEVYRKHQEIK